VKAWFISDVHLKAVNENNGNILLNFLKEINAGKYDCTHLFFLGDIFDFWVGDHPYFAEKFAPIIEVISALRKKKIEIIYFEGNHDLHVEKFWQRLDIPCFIDDQYFQLGKITLRAGHGDLINDKDLAYKRYRSIIRSRPLQLVAQILPAKLFAEAGDAASRWSRKNSIVKRRDSEIEMRTMIHEYAKRCFDERPFDIIINGHMHVRDDWSFQVGERKIQSINLGGWLGEPVAFWLDEKQNGWKMF